MSKLFTILHLSDAHFGNPKHRPESGQVLTPLLDDLKRFQEEQKLQPSLILFSGDLAYGTTDRQAIRDQYALAAAWLNQVYATLGVTPDATPLLTVPGNHDVDKKEVGEEQSAWIRTVAAERLYSSMEMNDSTWRGLLKRQEEWRKFTKKHFRNPAITFDPQLNISTLKLERSNEVIGVVGLNSSWASFGGSRDEKGRLWIGRFQLDRAIAALEGCTFKIAISHHPTAWLSDGEASEISERIEGTFHIHFHGHEHSQWFVDAKNHLRVEAGPCYSGSMKENAYSWLVLDFDDQSARLFLRHYEPKGKGGWIPYVIPDKTNDHGMAEISGLFAARRRADKEKAASSSSVQDSATAKPSGVNEANRKSGLGWVTVSYLELLDPDEIVPTGQTLISALSNMTSRGDVQPFVDRYSELLPAALEMIAGPGEKPHSTVMDLFPGVTSEPAWVGLVRGGRIHISTDGKAHAQVFLLGDDPQQAYAENYSVIRHCLGILLELARNTLQQDDLQVDVFAYHNDYETSVLRLNREPYSVTRASFGSDKDKSGLALERLAEFFTKRSELHGGTLKRGEGLRLSGRQGQEQTVAGAPVDLSDLAVAYRAVFYPGDNHTFVSLDPHPEPTRTRVNLGGFLENTRLGTVLLEADKRFKTISTGFDPNSFDDARSSTRKQVSDFLTSAERDLLGSEQHTKSEWVGTRFWYYPDSIRVDTDGDYESATIVKARFTADAERSRGDFASDKEYNERRRDMLLRSHRENIDHLNRHYADYAIAFPELAELSTVARLLSICEWISKRPPSWLDCDELLSVELPVCKTETERTQLLAATFLTHTSTRAPTQRHVVDESMLINLTPILEKTVQEFFQSADGVMKYLVADPKLTNDESVKRKAERLFATYKNSKLRDMLRSKEDVQAFASYAAGEVDPPHSRAAEEIEGRIAKDAEVLRAAGDTIDQLNTQIEQRHGRIEELQRQMSESSQDPEKYERVRLEHNQLVDEYQKLVQQYGRVRPEYEEVRTRHDKSVEELNALAIQPRFIVGISGGVSANPKDFNFRLGVSKELKAFKKCHQRATCEYTQIGKERWIKSQRTERSPSELPKRPNVRGLVERAARINRQKTDAGGTGSWEVAITTDARPIRKKFYDAKKQELRITEFALDGKQRVMIGQMDSDRHIVFRVS